MKQQQQRLDRVVRELLAVERVILGLRALKSGEAADPFVNFLTPGDQKEECKRLWRLVGMVNLGLADHVELSISRLEAIVLRGLRIAQVNLVVECGSNIMEFLSGNALEPITEGELRRRRQVEADRVRGPKALGVLLGRPPASVRTELRQRIGEGGLVGVASKLRVRTGDYCDLVGLEVPVIPRRGTAYDVRPDADAPAVFAWREKFDRARESAVVMQGLSGEEPQELLDHAAVHAAGVRAIRQVIAELAESDFGGEEPALAPFLSRLARVDDEVGSIRRPMEALGAIWPQAKEDEAMAANLRSIGAFVRDEPPPED